MNNEKKIGVIINSTSKNFKLMRKEYTKFYEWMNSSGMRLDDFYMIYTDYHQIRKDLNELDVIMIENLSTLRQYNHYHLLKEMDEYEYKIFCWEGEKVYTKFEDIDPLTKIEVR